MLTLSAPALRSFLTSSTLRTPPPTVSGMKISSATRSITCTMVSRASLEAVMSRKVSSSAPAASYLRAISTGSPASRSSTNLTPFTTRPAWTSRQGMIRLASIACGELHRGGEIELALVDGPSRDAAGDALALDRHERPHVVEAREAAARDHGHDQGLGEPHGRLDVHAGQHAVAPDVGVDHALDAVVLEAPGEVHDVMAGELGPSVGGDLPVLRIQAHDDVPGKRVAGLVEEPGI